MNVETQARKAADVLGEEVVKETISKLIQIERERCLRQIEKLRHDLALFEGRFGRSSQTLLQEYQAGNLGDDGDIMEWVMLIENLRSLEAQAERVADIQKQ